ncbi:MAG: hypothetical protein AAGC46_18445, partial [Solirubrobacteraceae bacterium]|nr:hypothetical protein [Patulibacter sp.]
AYLRRDEARGVHAGYFSIDKKTGHATDPARIARKGEDAGQADDVDAYDLILRNKEKLLSLDEPVRFLFSHSALREGWDNPNVFVMGMLKRSDNTVSRRQEIGRGLRLAVDHRGERVDDPVIAHQVNELTIVTDESYTAFAEGLQKEISESLSARPRQADEAYFLGKRIVTVDGESRTIDAPLARQIYNYLLRNDYIDELDATVTQAFKEAVEAETLIPPTAPPLSEIFEAVLPLVTELYLDVPKASDGRKLKDIPFNEANYARAEFQELWRQINHKATFHVDFDSDQLIANCVRALDTQLRVDRLQYVVEAGHQRADLGADDLARGRGFEQLTSRTETEDRAPESDVTYDLLGEVAAKTKLTRRTVCGILQGVAPRTFAMFAQNPEHFIAQASRIISEQTATATVEKLTYNLLDASYDKSIFTIDKSSQALTEASATRKHIYDYVVTDSNAERTFAADLERADEVAVYAKLPKGFVIPTPVGDYNPDWAIAFEAGSVRQIYFVAETKGELHSLEFGLRGLERTKIECAREFFKALEAANAHQNVRYDVVSDYAELMQIVS